MIRLSELKLPLSALPVHPPRAADAPAETDADRALPPHPIQALTTLAAKQLSIPEKSLSSLTVFKRSFDARKSALQAVFIVDVRGLKITDPLAMEAEGADDVRRIEVEGAAGVLGLARLAAGDTVADAVVLQDAQQRRDIRQTRQVFERQRLLGEERGDHQRQRRVFGAGDGDDAIELLAADDANPVHWSCLANLPGRPPIPAEL